MDLELGENVALRYFPLQKVSVRLGHLRKKVPNLVEINVVLILKIRCY